MGGGDLNRPFLQSDQPLLSSEIPPENSMRVRSRAVWMQGHLRLQENGKSVTEYNRDRTQSAEELMERMPRVIYKVDK